MLRHKEQQTPFDSVDVFLLSSTNYEYVANLYQFEWSELGGSFSTIPNPTSKFDPNLIIRNLSLGTDTIPADFCYPDRTNKYCYLLLPHKKGEDITCRKKNGLNFAVTGHITYNKFNQTFFIKTKILPSDRKLFKKECKQLEKEILEQHLSLRDDLFYNQQTGWLETKNVRFIQDELGYMTLLNPNEKGTTPNASVIYLDDIPEFIKEAELNRPVTWVIDLIESINITLKDSLFAPTNVDKEYSNIC